MAGGHRLHLRSGHTAPTCTDGAASAPRPNRQLRGVQVARSEATAAPGVSRPRPPPGAQRRLPGAQGLLRELRSPRARPAALTSARCPAGRLTLPPPPPRASPFGSAAARSAEPEAGSRTGELRRRGPALRAGQSVWPGSGRGRAGRRGLVTPDCAAEAEARRVGGGRSRGSVGGAGRERGGYPR